jgi:hypothetical protein
MENHRQFAILMLWKGERRSGSHKRLLYCVNVNRTSLDHLPLGVGADIDEMSHDASIAPRTERGRSFLWESSIDLQKKGERMGYATKGARYKELV